MKDSAPQITSNISSLGAGTDAVYSMAILGKTVLSLAFIIIIILALSYLLKRLNGRTPNSNQIIHTIASATLGPRERLVIVEVDQTWLVLGIGGGQITKLHDMPRPDTNNLATGTANTSHFGNRLLQAMAKRSVTPNSPAVGEK